MCKYKIMPGDDKCSETKQNKHRGMTKAGQGKFSEEVTSEQRPEGGEGGSHMDVWGRSFQAEEWQVQRPWGRNVLEASKGRRGHGAGGREVDTPGIPSLTGFSTVVSLASGGRRFLRGCISEYQEACELPQVAWQIVVLVLMCFF